MNLIATAGRFEVLEERVGDDVTRIWLAQRREGSRDLILYKDSDSIDNNRQSVIERYTKAANDLADRAQSNPAWTDNYVARLLDPNADMEPNFFFLDHGTPFRVGQFRADDHLNALGVYFQFKDKWYSLWMGETLNTYEIDEDDSDEAEQEANQKAMEFLDLMKSDRNKCAELVKVLLASSEHVIRADEVDLGLDTIGNRPRSLDPNDPVTRFFNDYARASAS